MLANMKTFVLAAVCLAFGVLFSISIGTALLFGYLYFADNDPYAGFIALAALGIIAIGSVIMYFSKKAREVVSVTIEHVGIG